MTLKSKHDRESPSEEWLEGLNRAILESALDRIITMDAQERCGSSIPPPSAFSDTPASRLSAKNWPSSSFHQPCDRSLTSRARDENAGVAAVAIEVTRETRIDHNLVVVTRRGRVHEMQDAIAGAVGQAHM